MRALGANLKIFGKYANLNKFKVTQSVEFFLCLYEIMFCKLQSVKKVFYKKSMVSKILFKGRLALKMKKKNVFKHQK